MYRSTQAPSMMEIRNIFYTLCLIFTSRSIEMFAQAFHSRFDTSFKHMTKHSYPMSKGRKRTNTHNLLSFQRLKKNTYIVKFNHGLLPNLFSFLKLSTYFSRSFKRSAKVQGGLIKTILSLGK